MKCKTLFLVLIINDLCGCSKVDTDVFAVRNAALLESIESHYTKASIINEHHGVNGYKTIPIKIHRIQPGRGWIIGIRTYHIDYSQMTERDDSLKTTLYFIGDKRPDGDYVIDDKDNNFLIITSYITPSFMDGNYAKGSFGAVNIHWESDEVFVLNIDVAFNMVNSFGISHPHIIKEQFKGNIVDFNSLTPWMGKTDDLDSWDGLYREVRAPE